MTLRGSIGLVCMLACLTVGGQYAVGLRAGPIFFDPLDQLGKRSVSNTSAHSYGATVQHVNKSGPGFRFGLEWVSRTFDLELLNDRTNRREMYHSQIGLLQLSNEIRFALGKSGRLFFDVGPVIGARVSERITGVAFYDHPGQEDPQHLVGHMERGLEIRDFRWRLGLSSDIPLTERLFMSLHTSASPGFSAWFRNSAFTTLDLKAACGIAYVVRVSKECGVSEP